MAPKRRSVSRKLTKVTVFENNTKNGIVDPIKRDINDEQNLQQMSKLTNKWTRLP